MKKIFKLLCLVALVATMAGCGDDEFEVFNIFDTTNYEIPTTSDIDKVSESTFNNNIVGYGWKQTETHEINPDGSYTREDYWAYMVGGGPAIWEFIPNEMISYFWSDAIPAFVFNRQTCSYNENDNIVSIDGRPFMRIIHYSDTQIKVVARVGVTFDKDKNQNRNVFLYITLRRLGAEELEKVREKYNQNVNDFSHQ